MPKSFFTLALTALLLSSACAAPRFDAAAESKKLLQRDAEWSRVASEGKDVERVVSYWSDDAVVIPQGQPAAEGKAAIRAFVKDSFAIPGFKVQWVSDRVTFSPDGQLAYMRGNNTTSVPGATGAPMTIPGRGLTVWRHEQDGQWRCVVDIWNDPPAAAAK
jgi:ketosteroid isomerase-like protein